MESEAVIGSDSGWWTSVEHIFGQGSGRIIPRITPGFHLQSYALPPPPLCPLPPPVIARARPNRPLIRLGISTADLNAFLSNFQICGSTLVSAQIRAAISTGTFARANIMNNRSSVTVLQLSERGFD